MNGLHRPLTWLALSLYASAQAAGLTALPSTYSSTIVDWPKGKTGTVRIDEYSSAPVDANGHFSIVLPTAEQLGTFPKSVSGLFAEKSTYESQEVCKGQGTVTPLSARYAEFGLQASIDGDPSIFLKLKSDTHLPYPLGQGYSTLTYFDSRATLDGSVSCSGFRYQAVLKGTFPAGWSLPSGRVTAISAAGVYTDLETDDPLPANVTWHLYDLITGIGVGLAPVVVGPPGVNITRVTPGAPAEGAGVRLNDLLVEVNGKSVTGLALDDVIALIRGDAGTVVTLGVMRGAETSIRRISVTRALIQVP